MQQNVRDPVAAVRAFNRLYTRKLGVLDQQLFESPYSLTEARVLYELADRPGRSAKEIGTDLGLDTGYLSRIVHGFTEKGLISRKASPTDRRQYQLSLTAKGRLAMVVSAQTIVSHDHCAGHADGAIGPRNSGPSSWQAMATIDHRICSTPIGDVVRDRNIARVRAPATSAGSCKAMARCTRRSMGSIRLVRGTGRKGHRQRISIASFDAARERCWIADLNRRRNLSDRFFWRRQSDDVAKLRLLLIDPSRARSTTWANAWSRECDRLRAAMRLSQNHVVDAEQSSSPPARVYHARRLRARSRPSRIAASDRIWSARRGSWMLIIYDPANPTHRVSYAHRAAA